MFEIHYIVASYCGVFTPWKSCNFEIRSREYATVDEAVFSPCRAEFCPCVAESHLASPRLLPGNSCKHLDDARMGTGHVTASAVGKSFFRVSDQGFIGETEARLQAVLEYFSVSSRLELWREDLCVIIGAWDCGSSLLRSVVRRRLVETGNPSACATVNWEVCISAIALYCLHVSGIRCECVTKC
jgi:hypothetical protein